MDIGEAVALRIQALCEKRGISVNRLAVLSGLTQSTVDSILKGKSRNPGILTLRRICDGLGMSLAEFLNDPSIDKAEC